MTTPSRLVSALAGLALLAGCGKAPPPPPAAPMEARFAAIARGRVDVEGGLVHVAAPREGVVSRVEGAPGDSVKAGDVLFALDTAQATMARDAAAADLEAAKAQVQLLRSKLDALKL
ncbi:MAG TPA: biotin/lipoyl-binding protein, partial [Rudaea sp.]|nr:biotin/lipoyl-binding protein [Rudaea sp.]